MAATLGCNDPMENVEQTKVVTPLANASNPYSLKNMQKALDKVAANSKGRLSLVPLEPTHNYIMFSPKNNDEINTLQRLGYNLSTSPLDVEEDAQPIGYVAPQPANDSLHYFYTLVPVNISVPAPGTVITTDEGARTTSVTVSGIMPPHTFVSELFLFNQNYGDEQDLTLDDDWIPVIASKVGDNDNSEEMRSQDGDETENLYKKATLELYNAGVDLQELYKEAMIASGHPEEVMEEDTTANGRVMVARYYPQGHIYVQDNSTGQNVPVKGIRIKSRRYANWGETHTDANGYFKVNAGYLKKAHVVIKFDSYSYASVRGISGALKVWEYVLPLEKEIGLYERGGMTNISHTLTYTSNPDSKAALHFSAAHFLNTLWDMRTFTTAQGIPNPPSSLNVWVSDKITTGGSAPMLRAMSNSSQKLSAIKHLFPNAADVIIKAVQAWAPDITMRIQGGGTVTRNAADISGTFFHELAHSLHYAKAGNSYWTDEIIYTVANGGYGNKTTAGSGRPAVVEAWGNYVGATFNNTKYINLGFPTTTLLDRRFLENQIRDDGVSVGFDGQNSRGWIPFGMLHDLTDTGEPAVTGITDNVNGYTMSGIFKGFSSSATTVQTLRQNILSNNANAQSTQVNQLVTGYGW